MPRLARMFPKWTGLDKVLYAVEEMTRVLRNEIEELRAQIEALTNQNKGFASEKKQAMVQSSEAAPITEASDIKPIVTRMRKKKVDDGADVSPANAASGE